MNVRIEVGGINEIIAELGRKVEAANVAGRRLIADYGAFQHDLTFQLSPYDALEEFDTFHMREQIKIETSDDGLSMEVGWRMADFTSAGFYPYYLAQEFGTIHMAAAPSLGPAWNELEPTFKSDWREALEGIYG